MSVSANVSPPRGMRDLLPEEVELRDWAQAAILDVYTRHGFRHVETPALESIALLTGGEGGENEKLIYKVLKRGEKLDLAAARSENDLVEYGLRYDLTVPLARYYAAHQGQLSQPFKAIQIGPVWRAERPQKGRFRQFTQCDIDVLGEAGEVAEAELILATTAALQAVGLSGFTLRINDRRALTALANRLQIGPDQHPRLLIALDKLDKIGMEGVAAELAGQAFAPEAIAQLTAWFAPGDWDDARLSALLQEIGAGQELTRLTGLRASLAAAAGPGVELAIDPTLVRGMGYYTGAIFEISMEGAAGSIAGGGRYDRMIGKLIGSDVPACGFSIGFERVIALLQERGLRPPRACRRVALLHDPETEALGGVLAAAAALRAQGHAVSLEARRRKAGKQLEELERQGFDGAATPAAGEGGPGSAGGAPEVRWFAER